jgi:5-methylcytosine-specific restriction endonuclease McrA
MPHEYKLSKKELRQQLWNEDPHCYWCGVFTEEPIQNGGRLSDDTATLDHLYTRYEMEKRVSEGNPFVLACNKCNHDRGEAATQAQPIEELWRRAGQLERMKAEGRINQTTV